MSKNSSSSSKRVYAGTEARKVLQEKKCGYRYIESNKTSDSVYEARKAMEQGQESLLPGECRQHISEEYTNIPVAEIILTGQEIALMVAAAKKLIPKKKHPQIALIGFESMFSDTSYFDELFGITLKTYFMKSMEQAAEKVELAIAEGADVLLGRRYSEQSCFTKKFSLLFYKFHRGVYTFSSCYGRAYGVVSRNRKKHMRRSLKQFLIMPIMVFLRLTKKKNYNY